jgi:hypothetical protein
MKNYRSIVKILSLLAGICLILSCKKFLEEPPSKTSSLVVKTTDQINALLSRQNSFYPENNRTAIFSTDDYGLNLDLYNARRASFSNMTNIQFMLWDTQYLPNDNRESFWSGEFKKIFTANLALNELDNVTGSAEDKAIIKADAHFIRAYSYWELANTYCLPYTEANKNEPGLPIKTSTSFEQPLQRQPLTKVYELIESDLSEALKIPIGINQYGKVRNWRASKAAVNAFAARYYLNRNNYTKAIEHVDAALADYNVLVDYNTEMRYGNDRTANINPGPNAQTITLKLPYTANNQLEVNQSDVIGWKELLYMRLNTEGTFWIIPSQDLLNMYDKDHDLRYQYHIVENWSYTRGLTNPSYDYPGYLFFFWDSIPTGPTVAEVLLIKAEAQARSNDPGSAMNTLNILRAKRMKPGIWVNLSASGKDDAIKKVLEERRREMPFAQRWFDIRRYNNNDDPNDDVVLTKTFYPFNGSSVLFNEAPKTFSLPVKSRRYAAPVPQTEIISSNGVIQQNTY